MTATLRISVILLAGFVLTVSTAAQQATDTPEAVLRALMTALYSGDVAAFERVTLPHPARSKFTAGARANPEALNNLKENPGGLQLREQRDKLFRGQPAKPGPDGAYPAGTTALYMVAHRGGPMAVPLVRQPEGWKVDLRWWIGMMALSAGGPPPSGSPEAVIRSLLAATLRFDRRQAAGFLAEPKSVDLLFLGGPSQREPSGVLDAAVFEMALVEIGAGEFYPMPVGPVVEGGSTADRKVFLGLFGPIEMAFVLVKKGADWKVMAQPYSAWMNR